MRLVKKSLLANLFKPKDKPLSAPGYHTRWRNPVWLKIDLDQCR
jgi:hypothetical protein